jgi:hypothetical protein
MSATGRNPRGGGGKDFFATPAWPVHRFLEHPHCPLPRAGRYLEPCAGEGDIVRAVASFGDGAFGAVRWATVEIRPECYDRLDALGDLLDTDPVIGDFLTDDGRGGRIAEVTLSNPPFKLAGEFIVAALRRTRLVVYLLRLGILETETRNDFMTACPPDVFVLPNRPSFDGDGTDATVYGWHVWDADNLERPGGGRLHVLRSTPAEVRRAQMPKVVVPRERKPRKPPELRTSEPLVIRP